MTRQPPIPRDIALDLIDVPPDRLRTVSPARIEVMASSFGAVGQGQPIIVRAHADPSTPRFLLVDGEHRYETARRIGWSSIRAEVHDLDDLQAKLAEVDANYVREKLSALDEAFFLAARKRTWDAIYPDFTRGGDRKSPKRQDKIKVSCWDFEGAPSFSKEVEARTGMARATVFRAWSAP